MTAHDEQHFTAFETVRDIVIGMPDGLTVSLALAAGEAFLIVWAISVYTTPGVDQTY